MKIVVVGCTHAGTAAVTQIAQRYPEAQITVYERNNNVSFLSCGIALHVGGVVADAESLFYSSGDKLAELGVTMKLEHNVQRIDAEQQRISGVNMTTGETWEQTYDKLVYTTGSWPIIPKLEGISLENIQLCKNYHHAQEIVRKAEHAQRVTVIGAGYIGIELVEAFEQLGKQVTLIDNMDRILAKYLDQEITDVAEAALTERGVKLHLGETVIGFTGEDGKVSQVRTTTGTYETDMVVLCIGFRPNTELLQGQIETLPNGAIVVDPYMRTSNPNIMAAGDNCAVLYNPTGKHSYIPLATNAVRMGALIAHNLMQPVLPHLGTQGTSAIKLYDLNIASTGMTAHAAEDAGLTVKHITLEDHYRPEFMPTYEKVLIKIVYEAESKRILGAQIMSKVDLTQCMNTLSVCIQNQMTMEQLSFVDFFFQPHYNKPWNLLNQAALQAIS